MCFKTQVLSFSFKCNDYHIQNKEYFLETNYLQIVKVSTIFLFPNAVILCILGIGCTSTSYILNQLLKPREQKTTAESLETEILAKPVASLICRTLCRNIRSLALPHCLSKAITGISSSKNQ